MKRIALICLACVFSLPLFAGGNKDIVKAKKKIKDQYIVVFEDRVADRFARF